MKKRIALLTAALLLIGVLGACSAKSASYDTASTESGYAYSNGYFAEEPSAVKDSSTVSTAAGAGSLTEAQANDASQGRKIIKNAELSVQTLEFDQFVANLQEAIVAAGGYIQSSNVNGQSYNSSRLRSASVTARIPAEKLDAFCSQISSLGNVTYSNIYTDDVTLTYVDLESHVKALRTEQETLLALLEKAATVEDIITIQSRLSEVLYEIESYESTLRTYDDLITCSTVSIDITEVKRETVVAEETTAEEISRRFAESLEDVKDGAVRFYVNFVSDSPVIAVWIVILGLITVVIVLSVKGSRKRKAKKLAKKQAKLAAQIPAPEAKK